MLFEEEVPNYQMTVSQFSATFSTGWSEEVLTCAWNPSELPRPETHIKPDVSHATQAHWRTSISGATTVKPTASVQTATVSFFWFYQSQSRNPQTVSVPKTHRPRRQVFICQFGCLSCSAQVSGVRDWAWWYYILTMRERELYFDNVFSSNR